MSLPPCVATLNRARSVTPPSSSVALSLVQSQAKYCLSMPVTISWDLEAQNNGGEEKSGISDAAFLLSSIYNFLLLETATRRRSWCRLTADTTKACIRTIHMPTRPWSQSTGDNRLHR